MEDADRDVLLDNEHAWSPLLLVIGTVLQAVLLILAFLVILIVPGLASDAVESVRSVVGTVTWMNGLSAFVASLLAMFIVRRRLRSIAMLVWLDAVCHCRAGQARELTSVGRHLLRTLRVAETRCRAPRSSREHGRGGRQYERSTGAGSKP